VDGLWFMFHGFFKGDPGAVITQSVPLHCTIVFYISQYSD